MCFRSYVGLGYGPHWCGIIFDVEYKALADILAQAKRFYLDQDDGCIWRDSAKDYYFEWRDGERLYLRVCKNFKDAQKYKGHSYSFIGFNELSKWGTSESLDFMLATQRSASPVEGMPRLVFSTTNPDGPGVPWIRNRYVTNALPGALSTEEIEVDIGDNRVAVIPKTKICLIGSYIENTFFTLEDIANLKMSVANNPELEAAWMRCDWNAAFGGGAIGDLWKHDVHIVENFMIPDSWRVNRAFDWGSSTPFSVGWFAESNGEEFTHDGTTYCYPRGTVVFFYEWYGSWNGQIGNNRGLRYTPAQVAVGIKQREYDFVAKGILSKGHKIYPGPADNQIASIVRSDVESIEDTMAKLKVYWTKSDKSPGSRINGYNVMREYFRNSLTGEGKGMYIQRRCKTAIELLPSLAKEGEDIAKDQEDHIYDMLRYRLTQDKAQAAKVDIRVY